MQKKWFKAIIWFVATALFFCASGIIISIYSAGPSEQQIMAYMSGMMNAMESSLMGLSMTIEHDVLLNRIITVALPVTVFLIPVSTIAGIYIRITRRKKNG